MNAILITGETYPHRRALRAAGAIWNHDRKGYLAKPDNQAAQSAALSAGLCLEPIDADPIDLEPATGERLRDIRQAKLDRKRDRLLAQAESAEKRAGEAFNRISPHERDFLRLAEPIKVGHHSERRHRKLIDRFNGAMSKAAEESKAAESLRRRADGLLPARVKGDAQQERDRKDQEAAELITVGDYVKHIVLGKGVVIKCNQRTFSVKFDRSGKVFTAEKRWCELIEKRAPIADLAHAGTDWKAGDAVELAPDHFNRVFVARVNRKTPRGYSVDRFWKMGDSLYVSKITVANTQITGPGTLPDWADQAKRND